MNGKQNIMDGLSNTILNSSRNQIIGSGNKVRSGINFENLPGLSYILKNYRAKWCKSIFKPLFNQKS